MTPHADYEYRSWAGTRGRMQQYTSEAPLLRRVTKAAEEPDPPAVKPDRRTIAVTLSILVVSVTLILGAVFLLSVSAEVTGIRYWIYLTLLSGISFCTVSYQLSRVGSAMRMSGNPRASSPMAGEASTDQPVTVLIPTYCEEPRVIRHTLLSAVLARHTNRRVVVLIDDHPGDEASVARSMNAVEDVIALLRQPLELLNLECANWKWRLRARSVDLKYETGRLHDIYTNVAAWLEELAGYLSVRIEKEFAHVDRFLIDEVVRDLSLHYSGRAKTIRSADMGLSGIDAEYDRIANLFCGDVSTFQRKQFKNLSHAPNKAMNLNAYIGLIGSSFDIVPSGRGLELREAAAGNGEFSVPQAEFVLTLDADSIIKSNYIVDLVGILAARPRVAVVQTPYLAFPSASSHLERIAGATTDIQYLYHQGSTAFAASFWVGANALLRTKALKDIVRVETREGVTCKIFIQDDTVIEDTGSTIDLLHAGWDVYNHPQALAYSATPSDFGALSIQRRRWSNGGLIIAPRFYAHVLKNSGRMKRLGEVLLRSNYLLSTIVGNLCVLVMMALIDGSAMVLMMTMAAMLPYFLLYWLDLRRLGYRTTDLLGVCALNLFLMPVCLSGVLDSLKQVLFRKRGRFVRTPKIGSRTVVKPAYILFNLSMAALMVCYAGEALIKGKFAGMLVPLANLVLYVYGFAFFIGFRATVGDLWLSFRSRQGLASALRNGSGKLDHGSGRIGPLPAE
jgi:cellulose synthase/poly-beta-1,6-N-acetylglucosamine synthase-like glycosyltransferase